MTQTQKLINNGDDVVDEMLQGMMAAHAARVAVLVNSLGSTPLKELYIMNARIAERLQSEGLHAHVMLVGPNCTALEITGASITLMHLDDSLQPLIDHPCDCAMFRKG